MAVLLLKLLLTPGLVTLASLAGRRWGAAVGGWLVGLPLTAAPVAVILAAEHGTRFAAEAATGILGGAATQVVFALAYAGLATSRGALACMLVASLGFAAAIAALNAAPLSLPGMTLTALALLIAGLLLLRDRGEAREVALRRAASPAAMPRWDLPARAAAATAFVLAVTALAGAAGPRLAGLLTPFPIYASVLTVFAHRQAGAAGARTTLRGLVLGMFAFVAFFVTLAVALPRIGWLAFAAAAVAAVLVQGLTFRLLRRPPLAPADGAPLATVSSRP